MGWQWHQLDHMQIICTSLQTDKHASTSSLSFYRLDDLPAARPTATEHSEIMVYILLQFNGVYSWVCVVCVSRNFTGKAAQSV